MNDPNSIDDQPEIFSISIDDLLEEWAEQAQRLFGDDNDNNDPDREHPLDAEQPRD